MRVLNTVVFNPPITSERLAGRELIASIDLELDTGIVARELKVVLDPATDDRQVWSKRAAGRALVEIDEPATAVILDLLDRAVDLGQYRAEAA